jgi:hypothetical protein
MKKIDEMSDYEILDIDPGADSTEIYMAYIRVRNALNKESMAHYALISDEEKEQLLIRVELAYQNLIEMKKREGHEIEVLEDPESNDQSSIVPRGIVHSPYKGEENDLPSVKMKVNTIIDQPLTIEDSSQSSPQMKSLKSKIYSYFEKWILIILFFIFTFVLFIVIFSFIPE